MKELGLIGHGDGAEHSFPVPWLVQAKVAEQSQEIRPLQADRPGGPRSVTAVRRQRVQQKLASEAPDRVMVGLDGLAHDRLLPRCRSIPDSPGRTRSRCRASIPGWG